MKKYYILTLIILALGYLFSAAPVVLNSLASLVEGQVVITYDLEADGLCQIVVLVSADDGVTYDIYPSRLEGAVGQQVESGIDKTIIWSPGADGMDTGENYKVKIIARDNPVDTEEEFESFIKVNGGIFNNGTADVTISSFYISKVEVTQAEYEAVMGTNSAHDYGVGGNYPVYYVSWFDTVEYCNTRSLQEGLTPCYNTSTWTCNFSANGYRLPTEMEWMFAAKGGNKTPATGYNQYAGTNAEAQLTNYAWYLPNNSPAFTKQVGIKLPNQLGLYDMSGNVWEWCNDWYGFYSSNAQTDPVGPTSGSTRVRRGGSWISDAVSCRVADRYGNDPSGSYYGIGFRVARSVEITNPQTVADPVISPAGGSFEVAKTVSITCATEGANIYYTLDGTEPTQASTLYTGTFELTHTKIVKAKAYRTYWVASNITTVTYVIHIPLFIFVESGTFNNGKANVTISDFYISNFEVTQAQYQAVMGTTPSYGRGVGNDYPVYYVTWNNAARYCNARSTKEGLTPCYNTSDWSCDFTANGYRLPTEMEWMFAAKGGNLTPANGYNEYPGTNIQHYLNYYGWHDVSAGYSSHPVGRLRPNQLGLYDMAGNVKEWCNDWYGDYNSSAQTDPVGPTSGSNRVSRGGSWNDQHIACKVAYRNGNNPTYTYNNIGFRVARRP